MRAPSYATLDDALELLAPYGIALTNGNSNHAPMVAEALCALGRPDAVMPWLVRYRERLLPRPEAGDRILAEDWRVAVAAGSPIGAPSLAKSCARRRGGRCSIAG
jgi:hypothetical protein